MPFDGPAAISQIRTRSPFFASNGWLMYWVACPLNMVNVGVPAAMPSDETSVSLLPFSAVWPVSLRYVLEGINVFYGAIHALKNVSFEVGEGEVVSLIGANGARLRDRKSVV